MCPPVPPSASKERWTLNTGFPFTSNNQHFLMSGTCYSLFVHFFDFKPKDYLMCDNIE